MDLMSKLMAEYREARPDLLDFTEEQFMTFVDFAQGWLNQHPVQAITHTEYGEALVIAGEAYPLQTQSRFLPAVDTSVPITGPDTLASTSMRSMNQDAGSVPVTKGPRP